MLTIAHCLVWQVRTGLTGRVASTGEKVHLKEAYTDPHFKPEIDWQAGYRVRSFLCMPLVKRIDGQQGKTVIGVMQLVNKHARDGFTDADEATLSKLCGQLHTAVLNYRGLRTTQLKLAEVTQLARRRQKALLWIRALAAAKRNREADETTTKIMKDGVLVSAAPADVESAPAPPPLELGASIESDEPPRGPVASASADEATPADASPGKRRQAQTTSLTHPQLSEADDEHGGIPNSPLSHKAGGGSGVGGGGGGRSLTPGGRRGSRPPPSPDRLHRDSRERDSNESIGRRTTVANGGGGGGFDMRRGSVFSRESSFNSRAPFGGSTSRERMTKEDEGNQHPLSLASVVRAYARITAAREGGAPARALDDMDALSVHRLQERTHEIAPTLLGIAHEASTASSGLISTSTAVGAVIRAVESQGAVAAVARRRMHLLLELAQTVVMHGGDEEGLLLAASRCAVGMGGAHGCRIFVVDSSVLWTVDAQRKRHIWRPEDAGLTGHVFMSATPLSIDRDAADHTNFIKGIDWEAGMPISTDLHTSSHICPHLPTSAHICPHLPVSPSL